MNDPFFLSGVFWFLCKPALLVVAIWLFFHRDIWERLFADVVTAVFWFHPAVWIARYCLFQEQEKACDESVLRSGVNQIDYAGHLLQLSKSPGNTPILGVATGGFLLVLQYIQHFYWASK